MHAILLLPFLLGSAPPTTYTELKASIIARRTELGAVYARSDRKDTVITTARAYLLTTIDAQFEHWKGTPWDFNGTTRTPGEGAIACGYFVTTVLEQAGFKIERVWTWHPLGNEELVVGGGCAHPGGIPSPKAASGSESALCGLLIGRIRFETATLLAWVPSDWWTPTLSESETPRELFLHGGDRNGAFRKRVSYAWGRIAVGEKERKKTR